MNWMKEMIQAEERSQAGIVSPFSGNNKNFCSSWIEIVLEEVRMGDRSKG